VKRSPHVYVNLTRLDICPLSYALLDKGRPKTQTQSESHSAIRPQQSYHAQNRTEAIAQPESISQPLQNAFSDFRVSPNLQATNMQPVPQDQSQAQVQRQARHNDDNQIMVRDRGCTRCDFLPLSSYEPRHRISCPH